MTVHDGVLPDGSPCWVECAYEEAHRGLHHAKVFYGRLFGWHIVDAPAEQGHYTICLKDDRPAAAITVAQDKNAPTVWTTYLASSDVDAAAQRVTAAGGTVLMGPQDVPGAGRAAFCADPSGGTFGIWQAGDFTGYGRSGEAGAIAAHTLLTRDLDGAKKFYAEVFGYRYVDETEFGVRVDLPEPRAAGGRVPSVRSPIVIDGTPMVAATASPQVGDHTAEVLADPGWGG